jgi:hypothetical protein
MTLINMCKNSINHSRNNPRLLLSTSHRICLTWCSLSISKYSTIKTLQHRINYLFSRLLINYFLIMSRIKHMIKCKIHWLIIRWPFQSQLLRMRICQVNQRIVRTLFNCIQRTHSTYHLNVGWTLIRIGWSAHFYIILYLFI